MKEGVDVMKMISKLFLITVLLSAISICGRELWTISRQYTDEAQLKGAISCYRPELPKPQDDSEEKVVAPEIENQGNDTDTPDISAVSPDQSAQLLETTPDEETGHPDEPQIIVNQSIIDMQNDVNTDIVGWLTIPNTRIDYPFVIAADNDFYLRRNIYKQQAAAGSIFMDCRCARDFTDLNTVIYGHNMKNRSMFGDLRLFADPGFFESNTSGTLFIKDNTYTLELFAYMVVRADDKLIFNPSADREMIFEYVQNYTRRYREPAASGNVVTLSTCAYEYDGARMVLLGVIIP